MLERRKQRRLIDSDLVVLTWQNCTGYTKQLGTVERSSQNSLDLVVGKSLPVMTSLTIFYCGSELFGIVRYLEPRRVGYLLGIELQGQSQNSTIRFEPEPLVQQHETFWEECS
jgi:hypothetical protein